MTFDLGYAVGDVEWAPYSSTVFSAVTSAGLLYVWDLHQEKHTWMCEHQAMKKSNNNKALHLTFNYEDPIILVGDEMGGVNSFKLSTSLRQGPLVYIPTKEEEKEKDEKKTVPTSQELEQQKMEKFLDSLDKIVY